MINKLKRKFMMIIMSIMIIVILVTFISINIIMHQSSERQSMNIMRDIANNDGIDPMAKRKEKLEPHSPEKFAPINNFSVKLDPNYNIISVVSEFKIEYDDSQILALTDSALNMSKKTGNLGKNIKFLIKPKPYGSIIVFLDNNAENDMRARLAITTSKIGTVLLIIIYFISKYLSNWAIKPVELAFEKQKQFIADASHELKTPITVIDANIDVLLSQENILNENLKWLNYIKTETKRMNDLVHDMLYLAKVDHNSLEKYEFNFSEVVESIVLPFESLIYEEHKTIDIDIQEDIVFHGDENSIKQVLAVLMDNAVKNCNYGGTILVSLTKIDHKIKLTVGNTGSNIIDTEKIFERFYREDKSRDRQTGAFGLGLSIAKTIVENHNGKIYAENTNDGVKFCVEF